MTQDKAPEWALKEAETIDIAYRTPVSNVRQDIALALSQAYERGQESMRERAAKAAERDADWTAFRRRNSVNWKGEETNMFAAPPDPDDTMPNDANVFAYGIGILAGEVIASTIRSLPIEQEGGE